MTPTELRLAAKANGFSPIPCKGTAPTLVGWTSKIDATESEVTSWGQAMGANTGIVLGLTTGWDTDILHPEASEAVEDAVKDWFDGRGAIPVRRGQGSKWATLLRTDTPFRKIARYFTDPNGGTHKIEILGEGQQIVVDGIHPDTGKPYAWHGDYAPWKFSREDLAETTESEVRECLEFVSQMLVERFGFVRSEAEHVGNGDEAGGYRAPVDVDQLLTGVRVGGIHNTELVSTASLLCAGMSVDAAVLTVLESMQKNVTEAATWNLTVETNKIKKQCTDWINKNPNLSHLLPDDLRIPFERFLAEGRKPGISFRNDTQQWSVKRLREPDKRGDPEPDAGEAAPDTNGAPHSYRFKLVSFADLRPGPEPLYLVDELIPIAGLVDAWGKAKCYKSFWILDLMLHVTMGWEYRDRSVRQGAVVYCAFEGAHGYKKRVEALRRHYAIQEGTEVPLYVMPGQANLILEHKLLIADISAQLGETRPVAVVLDTLNKSLFGSENKDVDMGAYVRAAEAIRDKFSCVVIIVHHCGYDETRPRGHSSLPGAVDAQLSIVRAEKIITVTVEMMRDGPEDTQVVSAVESIDVGQDQNGKTLTSLVVVPSEADPTNWHHGWPRGLVVFHAALKSALASHGSPFQPEPGVLPVRAVGQSLVRDRFYDTYAEAEEDDKKRKSKIRQAFNRALGQAQSREVARVRHTETGQVLVWIPERGEAS
jgi:hypothetical protein